MPIPGPTVDAIKKRGQLACGVDTGIPGFAFQDSSGAWQGFDVAYCRAIAAAVLGDPTKVRYVPHHHARALHRSAVRRDRRPDPRQHADHDPRLQLASGRGRHQFLRRPGLPGPKKLGVSKIDELNGATICTLTGATLELNIADFARSHGTKIGTLLFEKSDEAIAAMESGRCDGYTDDTGSLPPCAPP